MLNNNNFHLKCQDHIKNYTFKKSFNFLYNNNFHIGQLLHRWNIYMRIYILFKSKNFYIFNLLKTFNNLKLSIFFLSNVACNRGKILIVDNNKKYFKLLMFYKKLTKQLFFNFKWISGILTNFKEFFFMQIKEKKNHTANDFWSFKKSGFLKDLTRFPDCVIFLNSYTNKLALIESQILGLPLISVVNSDCNPSSINFVLANKDNNFIISFFYLSIFIESILVGYMVERNIYYKNIRRYYYACFLKKLKLKI
jgi:small subunit ribosomal protein S2